MYEDAKLKVDEIAERILTLRFQPTSNFTDYLKMSNIKESSEDTKDIEMVKILLEDHGKLLKQMRNVVEKADAAGDEGTIDMIGGFIGHIEKISWMLDAWMMKAGDNHPEA
jgi:starvation-inducible DNA-binding protein